MTQTEEVKPVSAPKRACNNKEAEGMENETEAPRDIGTDAPISLADRCFRCRSRSLSQPAKDALCVGPAAFNRERNVSLRCGRQLPHLKKIFSNL